MVFLNTTASSYEMNVNAHDFVLEDLGGYLDLVLGEENRNV